MFKSKVKSYFFFLFFFILLYNEKIALGPINVSQFWKILLFVYLFVVVIRYRVKVLPNFIKLSYVRSIKYFFNPGIYLNPIIEILEFSRYSLFPLFYHFLLIKKIKTFRLDKILLSFSIFFILSFSPFILGLLESRGDQIIYYEGFNNFTGIFQGAHAASITVTISVLLLLYFNKNYHFSKLNKLLNIAIIVFGVYIIYLTFVRTGYLMLILGVVIIYMPKKIKIIDVIKFLLIMTVLMILLYSLLEYNQEFYNRIFDIRNGKQKEAGSGRLVFWGTAYDLWLSGDYFKLIFGFGFENLTGAIHKVTGYRVYAHNEFFTQLAQNGLIGVVLLVWFFTSLFKFIYVRRRAFSYRIAITIFFVYISLMLTQGGFWFFPEFFLTLILYKLNIEFQQLT